MSEIVGRDATRRVPDGGPNNGSSNRTSAGNRFSMASAETGESSKRSSFTVEDASSPNRQDGHTFPGATSPSGSTTKLAQRSEGTHRSHRSRGSASFLVSNAIFEATADTTNKHKPSLEPQARRDSPRDHKGKAIVRTPEQKHKKNRSSVGLGIGGSPLATTVTTAMLEQEEKTSHNQGDESQDSSNTTTAPQFTDGLKPAGIDVESAQIVNLALNLSESRRQAARRNVSSPMPPTITGFGEGFAGGSLRHHLQAQRKSSRNVSPKPEKADRGLTATSRIPLGQRVEIPLQTAFGTQQDSEYRYNFSTSTLARAEKAKNAIELMAQYRRLLQYLPPLKAQILSRTSTRSPPTTAIGTPSHWAMPPSVEGSDYRIPLGRPYNPLQYIRNRKVRARGRETIDGESQGFGDVERVVSWVDNVARESIDDRYQTSDHIVLPRFAQAHETTTGPTTSPQLTLGRAQATTSKVKRPRVDWITNPADMLADIYWLEQNDNKRLIEDNRERKIFPQSVELTQPVSYKGDDPNEAPEFEKEELEIKLRLDTRIPIFNSLRSSSDRHSDSSRGRRRQSTSHTHDNIARVGHDHLPKSQHRSNSESSESDTKPQRLGHRRNAIAGSHDLNGDILEKQMLEILAKEGRENSWGIIQDEGVQKVSHSARSSITTAGGKRANQDLEPNRNAIPPISTSKDGHERKDSRGSQHPSGRASLELPEPRGRNSLEGLDSAAPNSPQAKALNITPYFGPGISINVSPSPSRRSSPSRQPTLAKVKSKISSFHDRSRNHSRSESIRRGSIVLEEEHEKSGKALGVPSTPEGSRRSPSPSNKVANRKREDNGYSSLSKVGSLRRRAEELPSGIRGLFKSGRQRIGDFIWKREVSPGSGSSSDASGDDSELEDGTGSIAVSRTTAHERVPSTSDQNAPGELSSHKMPKHYDLPIFRSPWEQGGRLGAPIEDVDPPEFDYISCRQQAREQRRISRYQLLRPPRIDVQGASPVSSPELRPTNPSSRNSDVSDSDNRRGSSVAVEHADARLNSILGLPGHVGRKGLPVTGLTPHLGNRRQILDDQRNWSVVYERVLSPARSPINKREVARVKALLLSTGVKAKEISRRAAEIKDLQDSDDRNLNIYADIDTLNRDPQLLKPVPKSQAHILAAKILSQDIQLSSRIWQETVSDFSNQTISGFLDRIEDLQDRIVGRNGLSVMTRMEEREADDVSKDLITSKTLAVKELLGRMEKILRRRRRRFRWVRRAGWVLLEWVLVGVMWWAWLVVVLIGFVRGTARSVFNGVRWLLWL